MSRESVLGAIRGAMQRSGLATDHTAAQAHLQAQKVAPRPAVDGDLVDRFCHKLDAVLTSWELIASLSALPAALRQWQSAGTDRTPVVIAPALQMLDWSDFADLDFGAAKAHHQSSVTPCVAAIAETGSIVLAGSAEAPATLSFLPEYHVVVLKRDDLVRHIEDVWPVLRQRNVAAPRAINFNTGPSRTADIEQTLEIGAHGPRHMHLMIVETDR